MKDENIKIISDLSEHGHGDAGHSFEITCDECGLTITVAQAPWWDTRCGCGYDWRLRAVGEK